MKRINKRQARKLYNNGCNYELGYYTHFYIK